MYDQTALLTPSLRGYPSQAGPSRVLSLEFGAHMVEVKSHLLGKRLISEGKN